MRKLYSITQAKEENVTNYAIRLESTLANIQRDHPAEAAWIDLDASKRDHLYLGLKKTYKESLRYFHDTGASFDVILKAARKAEAEAEHYKDSEPVPAKAAKAQELSTELMNEIAVIKAVANKAWAPSRRTRGKENKEMVRRVEMVEPTRNNKRRALEELVMDVRNRPLHQGLSQPP